MGQAMNRVLSATRRELNNYNLERRAEKIISKDKPTPAPMYPATVKELERLKQENVSTEYLNKKDERLDEFLKNVYVSSPDPAPPLERKINPNRPLPVKRTTDYGITYGYSESEEAVVPEGKVSLKQALTFISNHQNDPKKYSNAAIASQYKISLDDTNDILEYFKMLAVKVQKKEVDPASLTVYEQLQMKVKQMSIYNAPGIIKEMEAVFAKNKDKEEKTDERKTDERRPDEKDSLPSENILQTKEKSDLETRKGKENENIDLKNKEISEKENISGKPENEVQKGPIRKRSQENG